MTDPLATIRDRVNAGQKRYASALELLCQIDDLRHKASNLGYPISVTERDGRVDLVVQVDGDPVATSRAVLPPLQNRHLDDAGEPWPAKRDPAEVRASPRVSDLVPVRWLKTEQAEAAPSKPDCVHETTARVHSTGETECASCRESVSVPVLPPIRDPRGNAVPPAGKRRWTEEDEADLVARLERGESPKEIAAATGRHVSSVNGKITYVRTRKVPAKDMEVTTPPAEPVVAEAAPPPVEVTAPAADDEPDEDGWSRADELELLRLWNASRSPRNMAEEMGRSIEDVLARRVVLVPSKHPRDVARLYHERLRASMEAAG